MPLFMPIKPIAGRLNGATLMESYKGWGDEILVVIKSLRGFRISYIISAGVEWIDDETTFQVKTNGLLARCARFVNRLSSLFEWV